ncbi:MAG TPA: hypothetical protein VMM18_09840 [Gemmatimonadaceae bacterium]|nr:hypothetical protein [Gemmatimonadaceae bacterium]
MTSSSLLLRTSRPRLTAVIAALLFAAAACGDPGLLISRSIYTQAAQGPGSQVRFTDLIPFAYERVHIFTADAPSEAIRQGLGPASNAIPAEALAARGDSALLVFVRGTHVLFTVRHPPERGTFHDDAANRSYTPEDAVFVVDSASPPGRPILRPVATP